MKTKIAPFVSAFSGCPESHCPGTVGCSPHLPFLYRLPVVGEPPLSFRPAVPLPDGLTLDETTGILTGRVAEGTFKLAVTVSNRLGDCRCEIVLHCAPDQARLTPLLGWTSWNAFRNCIDQKCIEKTAQQLVATGLAAYGYQYVNIDSGWQGAYDERSVVQPHAGFPDMGALVGSIHALGLRAGIYSTPMLRAWGGGDYPGCTRGRLDTRFPDAYFGIGQEHFEKENADQWAAWGFDYLKYDWSPCDVDNAARMKQALTESGREFGYCVTVAADKTEADFWRTNCNSWRDNLDSEDVWSNVLLRFQEDSWAEWVAPGHYLDLDMLEIGTYDGHPCRLTPDEQVTAMTIRAFFPAPLQISCDLEQLTAQELAILCNAEILAVNQDSLSVGAVCAEEHRTHGLDRQETIIPRYMCAR